MAIVNKDKAEVRFESCKNGLIMKINHGPANHGEGGIEKLVYQEGDDEHQEIERFRDFLYYINESYGPSTSRYSKERIYIRVFSGDKYEGEDRIEEDHWTHDRNLVLTQENEELKKKVELLKSKLSDLP